MTVVRWTLPALADIEEIQEFIAADNPFAADRLINELVDRANALLEDNPRAGRPGRVAGTRELILAGTTYVIAYRVDDNIEILAVMHGARRWPEQFE